MNISFSGLEEWEKNIIKEKLQGHNIRFLDVPITNEIASEISDSEIIGVFIYSKIDRETIDKLPNLKAVMAMSTGYDHIDIEYCKEKNIVVCNVPTYGENTVAEHTFALIFGLSRKIYPSIKRTREQGSFETDITLRGFDLKNKTLGVIGYGNIGRQVVRIGAGLGMNMLIFDSRPNKIDIDAQNSKYVELDELIKNSDIITLHIPYFKENFHYINSERINMMKQGVYIINTARGQLIDTDALIQGLISGKIAGVGLDVLEEEGFIKEEKQLLRKEFKESVNYRTILENHQLMKMDNVLITPHNAFNSNEALKRILDTTIDNLNAYLNSSIKNRVN